MKASYFIRNVITRASYHITRSYCAFHILELNENGEQGLFIVPIPLGLILHFKHTRDIQHFCNLQSNVTI